MRRSSEATALLLCADLLLTQGALSLAEWLRLRLAYGMEIAPDTEYVTPGIRLAVLAIWALCLAAFRRSDRDAPAPWYAELWNLTVAVAVAFFALAGFFYWAKVEDFSRLLYAYFIGLDLALLWGLRLALPAVRRYRLDRGHGVKRVMVLGTGALAARLAERLRQDEGPALRFVGCLAGNGDEGAPAHAADAVPLLGTFADLEAVTERFHVTDVFIALASESRALIVEAVERLQHAPVTIRVAPDLLDLVTIRATVEEYGGTPLIGIREPAIVGLDRAVKRALDLLGATVGLLLFGPTVMAAAALAIKLDASGGPVLFVQERMGENGRPFRIVKFRTMIPDAEAHLSEVLGRSALHGAAFKIRDDPRVTHVGRFLRRTSIDELPQLFNVLWGDMSLVGPRPEELRVVRQYSAWHHKRLMVKPGLTGPMQINGRGDLPLDDRVKLELAYIENYSVLTDLLILLKTVPVVISGKGSY
ncbi:MAG: sugar transferase [Chloroflexi bacterium]|nr:sugar transferase [Chloroflexota bacterium]